MNDYFGEQNQSFESLAAKSGVTIPMLLKLLGIAPPSTGLGGDHFWCRNYGERLPLRGGSWHNSAGSGVFALTFNNPRALSNDNVGFRAALPLKPDIQSLRVLSQCRGIKGFAPLLNGTTIWE